MASQLTLIRGLPGSGKSTLAKQLAVNGTLRFEADQYFYDSDGKYKFDINHIMDAHDWCQDMTSRALNSGFDVIVSNTFTTIRELLPYVEIAKIRNASLNVILCQMNFGSIHDVPPETFQKMKNRFQYDISTLFDVFEEFKFLRNSN